MTRAAELIEYAGKIQWPHCGRCGRPAKFDSLRVYADGRKRHYWTCCGLSLMELDQPATAREMKVQVYKIGQGTTDWDWTSICDGIEIQPMDGAFATRELAIADAQKVADSLGLQLKVEGEGDAE